MDLYSVPSICHYLLLVPSGQTLWWEEHTKNNVKVSILFKLLNSEEGNW